jgi:hypothetical protein
MNIRARFYRTLLAASAFAAAALPLPLAAATPCPGVANCIETRTFTATLSEFRSIQAAGASMQATATIRFRNKTDKPLILGYVDGSGVALDEQGNRFSIPSARTGVRGIGVITSREFDSKFSLAPGEQADARFELQAYSQNPIYGTIFNFDIAVREIDPVAGNQLKLGREHSFGYSGLTNGLKGTPAAAPAPTAGTAAASPAMTFEDPCQGKPACSSSGPVIAEVTRMLNEGMAGNYHNVLVTVRFRNLGNAPLILNYSYGSGTMTDNLSQSYDVSSQANEVQGMPVSTRDKASSQFTLAPGEARNASIRYRRFAGTAKQIGTSFSPSFSVEQYELLPSNQLRLVREYSLNFSDLRYGGTGGAGVAPAGAMALDEALQKLFKGDGDKKKKKKD